MTSSTTGLTRVGDVQVLGLARIGDARGNLTVVEAEHHVPFPIRRVFYMTDLPNRVERGAHAHKELLQFVIAAAGSFDLVLDDGIERRAIRLDRSDRGVLIPVLIWGELNNFSPDAVCMVLASDHYDEADYLRDYDEFKAYKARHQGGVQ